MKSASNFELDITWWLKERPLAIAKDADARKFGDLLKAFAVTLRTSRNGVDEAGLTALRKDADEIETAARKLVKVVEALAKPLKGADRKDLDNTADALGRPLSGALKEAIAKIEVVEEDDNPGQFGSADAHALYLRKRLKKVKSNQMFFAVTLPTNEAVDLRMAFHPSAQGNSLAGKLKKACKGKKTTFGVAGTEDLADAVGSDDSVASGTLVLYVEGSAIPGLAKRVRKMFKLLGVKVFAKVRVIKDGVVLDASEGEDDNALIPDMGLDEDDDQTVAAPLAEPLSGQAGDASVTATTEAQATEAQAMEPDLAVPGARKAALSLRFKDIAAFFVTQPDALREQVKPLLREAGEGIRSAGDDPADPLLDRAEKIIGVLEKRMNASVSAREGSAGRSAEARDATPENVVDFMKAQLLWGKARGQLRSQIKLLVDDIVASCGDNPDYAEWKAEAPSLLEYGDAFDDRLEKVFDLLDKTRTLPERQELLEEADRLIRDYTEELSDEFFEIAETQKDLPSIQASSIRKALGALGNTVKQGRLLTA